MIYFCSQKNRRALVLQHPGLNGIDYLEVCTTDDPDCGCGKQLFLTLLKDARNLALDVSQLQFTGGAAKAQVKAIKIDPATSDTPRVLTITLDQAGDFSTYTLQLLAVADQPDPPDGFDPQLSVIDFSFKAGCPTTGDCVPTNCCPPDAKPEPDLNYLAKDYEGFRQVMLDRMAVTSPAWTERHPSDLGVALVEALAYAADHYSYQQDAVGTEAYLGTARSRISLRRHARLVDYQLDEGSNARTWIYFKVIQDPVVLPKEHTLLFPRRAGSPAQIKRDAQIMKALLSNSPVVFATLEDATLHIEQNEMPFYTWSDTNCCLVPGATQATLHGHRTTLQIGSVLLFEEVMGPETGDSEDADPAKRWVVRLTGVRYANRFGHALVDPLTNELVTEIYWDAADVLPFPLCISATTGSKQLTNVSVARGNMIAADHGLWQDWTSGNILPDPAHPGQFQQSWESVGTVPDPPQAPVAGMSCTCGTTGSDVLPPRPRFYPELQQSPLTFARAYDNTGPASSLLAPAPNGYRAAPVISVLDDKGDRWQWESDLLLATDTQAAFLVEIERDNSAFLRFGDGQYGAAPEKGVTFQARYRVGNGSAGNIGHDVLAHVMTDQMGIALVRNPLPATGGVDPENMEHIRQQAPYAFRTQLRAVTEDDYGTVAIRDAAIREARGTLRWTGSWYTAFVSIDSVSALGATPTLVGTTKQRLNLFRMAGVDLEIEAAKLVGLRIELNICVDPAYFQADVRDAIMRLFTAEDLCDGTPGILNPQNFTFGQTIYTSPLVTAAQDVEGVSSAQITAFQRMDDPSQDGVAQGFLTMGRIEIARCDNDPNRLDRGILVLHVDGGK